jgi:hypothetical protein
MSDWFRNRWSGNSGSIICPPRNPDLISLKFIMCRYAIRKNVYAEKILDLRNMRQRIHFCNDDESRHALSYLGYNGILFNACTVADCLHVEICEVFHETLRYFRTGVQTVSGAHPASYPMGTRGSFPGG